MRILFVIDGLPGGGAEKVVLTLAAQFLRDGDRVSLISLRDVCEYPLPEGLDYQVVADRCRKPWRKLTELSRRARQLDAAVVRAEQQGQFDLVLSNLHKTDRIVARSRALRERNVWFCLHGVFSASYLGHRTGFDRQLDAAVVRAEQQGQFDLVLSNLHKTDRIVARSRALRERNVWFCLHGVFSASYLGHRTGFDRWMKQQKIKRIYQGRNVVTVSDAVGRDLVEEFALRPAQLKTIYNPFDIAALRAEAEADSERPDGDYLIHVGRFHPGKRHDRLLEAYAQSGIDAPLVLLGQGKPEQEQRLRQLAKTLHIDDRVWFKGFQKNPLPWIKGARMLVLSSDSEGFGNVVVEALLLHTPVASTRCPGGVTEILTGELARGLADLTSPALAQTMQSIYHNPPAIDDAALEKFSVVSICQQYRQLQRT
ncbi:glycosyltransferase [Klebsiella pneumoniae]|nr:glycosyltransferase [Klebsiella pneumoniae]